MSFMFFLFFAKQVQKSFLVQIFYYLISFPGLLFLLASILSKWAGSQRQWQKEDHSEKIDPDQPNDNDKDKTIQKTP